MVVNGWRLLVHPLFEEQLEQLTQKVERAAVVDPAGYQSKAPYKLLTAINLHIKELVPLDPGASEYRQGNTLGKEHRHWFRVKFLARYRLFFRYSTATRVIVYAWVNDEGTLRKSGSKSDPYAVFEAMLASGDPPSSWDELLKVSKEIK